MSSLSKENLQKNLSEIKGSFDDDELIEGYFETLNYTAEEQRKSPISGTNVFGYLFVDEWVWNTIFVLTNKKLYLINTKEDFEKVSTNKILLENIEHLNVFMNDEEVIIELKVKGVETIQYKPFSNEYLSIIEKMDRVNIFENKKPRNINNSKLVLPYVTGGVLIFVILIIAYIVI